MINGKFLFIFLTLIFSAITFYFLYDEALQENAIQLIEQVPSEPNLENNAFIHLASISDSSSKHYQNTRSKYLQAAPLIENGDLNSEQALYYPENLIRTDSIDNNLYCYHFDKTCLANIKEHKALLENTFKQQILLLNEFLTKSGTFDYAPLNLISAQPDVMDGLPNMNYLVGLSIYLKILDNNLTGAEFTLANYFQLLRKLADADLGIMTSVHFSVSFERVFKPMFEQLNQKNHSFSYFTDEILQPINNPNIAIEKIVSEEFYILYVSLQSMLPKQLKGQAGWDNQITKIPFFKPNLTLNNAAKEWNKLVPGDDIDKKQFLGSIKKWDFNNEQEPDTLSLVLSDPSNAIGNILSEISRPINLLEGAEIASIDLNLLLLKFIIQNQSIPTSQLVENDEFIDPYTGNRPYLKNSQVCYKAWPELMLEQDICIAITPFINAINGVKIVK